MLKSVNIEEHKPSLPATVVTPTSERTKVASNPVRTPINKQTALLLRPEKCWLSQPLPDPLQKIDPKELQAVKAALKIERNNLARVTDELGITRASVRALKLQLESKAKEIVRLRAECVELKDLVRQLEDLKL